MENLHKTTLTKLQQLGGVIKLMLMAWASQGEAMTYQSPLTGENKVDWFISFFVDRGDGVTPRDYMGGQHTYRGHGGMDIFLLDWKKMDEGIDVLAAAPGTVVDTQDGYFDRYTLDGGYPLPGNWVTVLHTDTTHAVYYHLERNSICVTNGQVVAAGQPLGRVGSPGFSGGPHLHFQVCTSDWRPCEIMTNDMGQTQDFGWYDSYSNQVVRQVLAMGLTKEDDPDMQSWEFNLTPRSYSVFNHPTWFGFQFGLWLKYVGFAAGDRLAVRMRAVAGPGATIDLSPWAYNYASYMGRGVCHWTCTVWPPAVSNTTFQLQYCWNDGAWRDAPGAGEVRFTNDQDERCVERVSRCRMRYVSARSSTPRPPYASWATAAATIQDAINICGDGDTVLVTNGVYAAGGKWVAGAHTVAAIDKAILVRSVNGAAHTVIAGNATARCAYVAAGGVLAGFAVTNGAVTGAGDAGRGGGIFCLSEKAVLCNSVVIGNRAREGGGVYGGKVFNCLLAGNTAAEIGGGASQAALTGCTLADNSAGMAGGGLAGGSLYNGIAWYNTAAGQTDNYAFTNGNWAGYSCLTPLCAGNGNMASNPCFADRSAGNYRLSAASPCREAGNESDLWTRDLDGRARVIGVRDMGAYEYARPLAPPPVLSAGAHADYVQLAWSAVEHAVAYEIWRGANTAFFEATRVTTTTGLSHNDAEPWPGQTNWYWVKSVSTDNVSAAGACVPGWRQELWQPVPADYDGDGYCDPAVYRPSDGTWRAKLSTAGYAEIARTGFLGAYGWTPLAADFDGDRKADPAVYRETDGAWRIRLSANNYGLLELPAWFGTNRLQAAAGDFDGDGKADPVIYDAIAATWVFRLSTLNYGELIRMAFLGGTDYVPTPADFDGDRLADPAIYNANTGVWYFRLSASDYELWELDALGGPGWIAAPGDYDGDGRADPAVFAPATGAWQCRISTMNYGASNGDK